jgi:release factor glutamine methyltransferase
MPPSLFAVVSAAARRLVDGGGWTADDARRDADVLARHLLRWDQADWLARQREPASDGFSDRLQALVARRCRHEPIGYIVGSREFFGRSFRVTPDVLIPRPETEHVVEEALRMVRESNPVAAASDFILDVGTGSGCLAITLALEVPGARVVATDISAGALRVAAENAEALAAGRQVRFVRTSLAEGLAGPFGLIVSNPPYVAASDAGGLMPDVRDYEPAAALFAGDDGLDVIRGLIDTAGRLLRRGGMLAMEIGAGQASAVSALVERQPGLSVVALTPDLSGIPRVVLARRAL